MAECNQILRANGVSYPRTCRVCGLGPCTSESGGAKAERSILIEAVLDAENRLMTRYEEALEELLNMTGTKSGVLSAAKVRKIVVRGLCGE